MDSTLKTVTSKTVCVCMCVFVAELLIKILPCLSEVKDKPVPTIEWHEEI